MIVHLSKTFSFEASHQLPNHDGKCARLHGHSWLLKVWIAGHVQDIIPQHPKEGMVQDYSDVKMVVQPIIDMLDHHHLGHGEVEASDGFHDLWADYRLRLRMFPKVPTSENILIWISKQLPPWFSWVKLELSETCTANAVLIRAQHSIWLPDIAAEPPAQNPPEVIDDDIPF